MDEKKIKIKNKNKNKNNYLIDGKAAVIVL